MDKVNFERMLEEIYSVFGRTAPACGSPMYNNLYRRLVDGNKIPNEAVKAIAYAFENYDTLPMNLGKAIMLEFSKWRVEHPEKIARRQMCPRCNSGTAGWVYCHDANGKNYLMRCVCNPEEDPNGPAAPVASKSFLEEHGLVLGYCIDPWHPEGRAPEFNFLPPEMKERLIASYGLGNRDRVRPEHLAAREAAGADAYGGDYAF